MNRALEWAHLKGPMPPFSEDSKLMGSGPYYLWTRSTVVEGKIGRKGEMKWRNLQFQAQPPGRVNPTCWLGKIQGRDFIFLFGGQVLDTSAADFLASASSNLGEGGKYASAAKARLQERAKQQIFKASTKMYCCDIEKSEWKPVALTKPMPAARELASAIPVSGDHAMIGFGRSLPERIKQEDIWVFDSSQAEVGFPDVEGCIWHRVNVEKHSLNRDDPKLRPRARVNPALCSMYRGGAIFLFGGQVGDLSARPSAAKLDFTRLQEKETLNAGSPRPKDMSSRDETDEIVDDMWRLDMGQKRWTPVRYSGYYPGARRAAHLVRASDTEMVLFGGFAGLPGQEDVVASPKDKKSKKKLPNYLDVLIFDCELNMFTRPAIGFLPRDINPACLLSDAVPTLYLGRTKRFAGYSGGAAQMRYAEVRSYTGPPKDDPADVNSLDTAERLLFRTRKEMDELDTEISGIAKEKGALRKRLDECKSYKKTGESETALQQLNVFRKALEEEMALESALRRWISVEQLYRSDAEGLGDVLKNVVAAGEAKLFADQALALAEANSGSDEVLDALGGDCNLQYSQHSESLRNLKQALSEPRIAAILGLTENVGATKREDGRSREQPSNLDELLFSDEERLTPADAAPVQPAKIVEELRPEPGRKACEKLVRNRQTNLRVENYLLEAQEAAAEEARRAKLLGLEGNGDADAVLAEPATVDDKKREKSDAQKRLSQEQFGLGEAEAIGRDLEAAASTASTVGKGKGKGGKKR